MKGEPSRRVELQQGVDAVERAFGETDGDLTAVQHQAIVANTTSRFRNEEPASDLPAEFSPLLHKLALHAYKVTDKDVAHLQEIGYSDDAIFELIVGGSLGAGLATWEDGLSAIDAFFVGEQEEKDAA